MGMQKGVQSKKYSIKLNLMIRGIRNSQPLFVPMQQSLLEFSI